MKLIKYENPYYPPLWLKAGAWTEIANKIAKFQRENVITTPSPFKVPEEYTDMSDGMRAYIAAAIAAGRITPVPIVKPTVLFFDEI